MSACISFVSLSLPSLSSLINSRGVMDELVWEEELAAREAGYGATSSVPKVSTILHVVTQAKKSAVCVHW